MTGGRESNNACTTPGSARVEISPSCPSSRAAIFRKMRRMIFPERVLGRPGALWITSGIAKGPIDLRSCIFNACSSSALNNALTENDVGVDALALDLMGHGDNGGLNHIRMPRQSTLQLGCA